jgi:hypothetical protein
MLCKVLCISNLTVTHLTEICFFIIAFRSPQPQSQVIYQVPVLSQDLKSLTNSVSTLKMPSQKSPATIAKVGRSKQSSVYICTSSNTHITSTRTYPTPYHPPSTTLVIQGFSPFTNLISVLFSCKGQTSCLALYFRSSE